MARIAIITGAASGIGRALARALVLRGDTVVWLTSTVTARNVWPVAWPGKGRVLPRPRPWMSATPPPRRNGEQRRYRLRR
jgi:hypothetical protein